MFYLYILKSLSTNQLYIGQTNNLSDRLFRHNSNRNKYTKNKGPWELMFSKTYPTRSDAVNAERYLKSLKNRDAVQRWIASEVINDASAGQ